MWILRERHIQYPSVIFFVVTDKLIQITIMLTVYVVCANCVNDRRCVTAAIRMPKVIVLPESRVPRNFSQRFEIHISFSSESIPIRFLLTSHAVWLILFFIFINWFIKCHKVVTSEAPFLPREGQNRLRYSLHLTSCAPYVAKYQLQCSSRSLLHSFFRDWITATVSCLDFLLTSSSVSNLSRTQRFG